MAGYTSANTTASPTPAPSARSCWSRAHTFDVVDISERGIRFRLGDAVQPEPGYRGAGTVRFRRGETIAMRGTVLRVNNGEVAVRLEEGVPLRVIMEEQRFLLDRHRHLGM